MRGKVSLLIIVFVVCTMLNVHLTAGPFTGSSEPTRANQFIEISDKMSVTTVLQKGYVVGCEVLEHIGKLFGYEE